MNVFQIFSIIIIFFFCSFSNDSQNIQTNTQINQISKPENSISKKQERKEIYLLFRIFEEHNFNLENQRFQIEMLLGIPLAWRPSSS